MKKNSKNKLLHLTTLALLSSVSIDCAMAASQKRIVPDLNLTGSVKNPLPSTEDQEFSSREEIPLGERTNPNENPNEDEVIQNQVDFISPRVFKRVQIIKKYKQTLVNDLNQYNTDIEELEAKLETAQTNDNQGAQKLIENQLSALKQKLEAQNLKYQILSNIGYDEKVLNSDTHINGFEYYINREIQNILNQDPAILSLDEQTALVAEIKKELALMSTKNTADKISSQSNLFKAFNGKNVQFMAANFDQLNAQYNERKTNLQEASDIEKESKQQVATLAEKEKNAIKKVQDKTTEVAALNKKIQAIDLKIKNLNNDPAKDKSDVGNLKTEQDALAVKLEEATQELEDAKNTHQQCKDESKQANKDLKTAEKEKKSLEGLIQKDARALLDAQNQYNKDLEKKRDETLGKLNEKNGNLTAEQSKLTGYNAELTRLQSNMKALENELKNRQKALSASDLSQEQKEKLTKERDEAQDKLNDCVEKIEEIDNNISESKGKIAEYQSEISTLNEEKNDLDHGIINANAVLDNIKLALTQDGVNTIDTVKDSNVTTEEHKEVTVAEKAQQAEKAEKQKEIKHATTNIAAFSLVNMSNGLLDTFGNRLANVALAAAGDGDLETKVGVWGKVLFNSGSSAKDTFKGLDSSYNNFGGTIGVDATFNERFVVGAAFTLANGTVTVNESTKADAKADASKAVAQDTTVAVVPVTQEKVASKEASKASDKHETKTSTNIVSLYGQAKIMEDLYVDAGINLGQSKLTDKAVVNKDDKKDAAKEAKKDSTKLTLFDFETKVSYNMILSDNVFLRPFAGMGYTSITLKEDIVAKAEGDKSKDSAKEKGDKVESKSKDLYNSARIFVGTSIGTDIINDNVIISPELHVRGSLALGGGSSKDKDESKDKDAKKAVSSQQGYNFGSYVAVGASASIQVNQDLKFGAGIDKTFAKEFGGLSGFLRAQLSF